VEGSRSLTAAERAERVEAFRDLLAHLHQDELLRHDVAVAILEGGGAAGVLWLVGEMLKRGRTLGLIDDLAMGAGGAALDLLESTLRALTHGDDGAWPEAGEV